MKRIDWEKDGGGAEEPSLFNDDSDEELDPAILQGLAGGGDQGYLQSHGVGGLLRDMPPAYVGGADPNALIQDRLMGIRMDIERLLFDGLGGGGGGMPGFMRDPFDHDGFGYNGLFGGGGGLGLGGPFGGHGPPGGGFPPRQHQRDRERVNQANAQRDVREQAVNWAASLFRAPESSA